MKRSLMYSFDLGIWGNRTFLPRFLVFLSRFLSLLLFVVLFSVSLFFLPFFCEGGSFGLIELVENEGRGRSERDFSCKLETRYMVGETKGTRGSNWKWYLVTTFQQPCPNNVPFSTMVPLFVYACRGCLETSVTLIKW